MLQAQRAYYAGLFDGEGSVYLAKQYRNRDDFNLVASIAMTDTVALKALFRDFGGCICTSGRMPKPSHHRQPYKWTVKSRKAAAFLKMIRPYMLIKSEQVDVALEFQKRVRISPKGRGYFLSPEEKSIRLELRYRLQQLKKLVVGGVLSGIGANSGKAEMANPELTRRQSLKRVETLYPDQAIFADLDKIGGIARYERVQSNGN